MFGKIKRNRIIRRNLVVAMVEKEEAVTWAGTSREKTTDAWVREASLKDVAYAIGTGSL